jgi:hypothetical protein
MLFAAFHALLRLMTPRHPPCAFPSSAPALTHDAKPTGSTHSSPLCCCQCSRDPVGLVPITLPPEDGDPHEPQPSLYPAYLHPSKTARLSSDRHRTRRCRSSRTSLRFSLQFLTRTDALNLEPPAYAARWAPDQYIKCRRLPPTFVDDASSRCSDRFDLVEMGGFEPPTSRVQGGRSPTELHPQVYYPAERMEGC